MKGIILLNGEPYPYAINAGNALVYCCDGAYKWAKSKVRIDKNIGDFDSLDEVPYPPPEEVYPAEKNFTDGEIALKKIIEAGADEIEIYGGGGGQRGPLPRQFTALVQSPRPRRQMHANHAQFPHIRGNGQNFSRKICRQNNFRVTFRRNAAYNRK